MIEYGIIFLGLAVAFGLFMAWGVGANDVANAMGTSVGSGALTIKQALIIALIFEFMGAWLAGGEVSSTIRKGIVDTSFLENDPELLVFGMLSALLAASLWLAFASSRGWPVSTTHSIVGAIVGFAAVGISMDAVSWEKVGKIVSSWVVSPILAGGISFLLYKSVRIFILNSKTPFKNALRYIPVYMFAVGFLISMVTILKGLKYVLKDNAISLTTPEIVMIAIVIGLIVAMLGGLYLHKSSKKISKETKETKRIEGVFAILMIFTACAMAFAHGSNDVANAVGPIAAIFSVVESGSVSVKSIMPSWVLLLGAAGIGIGLITYGFKVMGTIGKKITELTPSLGFAAELGAAATVVVASIYGLPISTTHTLVGAVLGVGLARAADKVNFRVLGTIVMSWVITIPVGATLSILIFFTLKAIFSG